jgi:[protein-PII] uridylyltransferase
VAAPDRHGLLAILTGTFALAGLDILGANSAPSRSGVALDTFIVTSATLAPVSAETWSRLERMLAASLAGRFALSVRLTERRRHYVSRTSGAAEIRIEEDALGALLHVRAPDRVGLLHDIARAISDSGLDVRSLTATSRAGWAEDTLRLEYVTGAGAGALGQLAMRLREL